MATGCRDESAARSVLAKLERRAELVKGEVLTAAEAAAIDHQDGRWPNMSPSFFDHQTGEGRYRGGRLPMPAAGMNGSCRDCGFAGLADLSGTALEKWLAARQAEGMGAVTRNAYREAWVTFGNWCVRNRRLLSNPFADVPKADAKADPSPEPPGVDRRRTSPALGRGTPPAAVGRDDGSPGQAKRRSGRRPAGRHPPPAGTARAGTGLDLQDAGADRASQGRIGFAHRGASGA